MFTKKTLRGSLTYPANLELHLYGSGPLPRHRVESASIYFQRPSPSAYTSISVTERSCKSSPSRTRRMPSTPSLYSYNRLSELSALTWSSYHLQISVKRHLHLCKPCQRRDLTELASAFANVVSQSLTRRVCSPLRTNRKFVSHFFYQADEIVIASLRVGMGSAG